MKKIIKVTSSKTWKKPYEQAAPSIKAKKKMEQHPLPPPDFGWNITDKIKILWKLQISGNFGEIKI